MHPKWDRERGVRFPPINKHCTQWSAQLPCHAVPSLHFSTITISTKRSKSCHPLLIKPQRAKNVNKFEPQRKSKNQWLHVALLRSTEMVPQILLPLSATLPLQIKVSHASSPNARNFFFSPLTMLLPLTASIFRIDSRSFEFQTNDIEVPFWLPPTNYTHTHPTT